MVFSDRFQNKAMTNGQTLLMETLSATHDDAQQTPKGDAVLAVV